MRIYIPTKGRVGRQLTRVNLQLDSCPWPVTYVVPESEHMNHGPNILVVPQYYRFSETKQMILDQGGLQVVIDDDLQIFRRGEGTRLHLCTPNDIKDMWAKIYQYLMDGYVHGAISAREGNNHNEADHAINTRAMRFHFWNADILNKEKLQFTDIETKQDFHMTLSLLELGYMNIVDFEFAQNQAGSDTRGGCSSYRTKEVMDRDSHRLAELHPGFVTVVKKDNDGEWGQRTDVRIAWKKALGARRHLSRLSGLGGSEGLAGGNPTLAAPGGGASPGAAPGGPGTGGAP